MRSWLGGAVVAGCLVAGCGGDPLSSPDVVARLAGEQIGYGDFEAYLRRNSIDSEVTLEAETLSRLFDQFLEERLILRLAADRGMAAADDDPAVALAALLERAGEAEVADEEIEAYYRAHPERFRRPERVRLSQILVEGREQAEECSRLIDAGTPFAEVARRHSIEPAASRGGDQGVLTRDDLPPAFVETVFALEEGETSGLVSADYGYHLFQVTARWPAESEPLERAAPGIRRQLARQTRAETRRRLVREARQGYNLRVDERNLPFRYRGAYASEPPPAD